MYRLSLILRFLHLYLSHLLQLWLAVLPKALEPYIIGIPILLLISMWASKRNIGEEGPEMEPIFKRMFRSYATEFSTICIRCPLYQHD